MSNKNVSECPRCGVEGTLKARHFSPQATVALLSWGDLEEELVGAEICGECYAELREVLVERTDDVENVRKAG